jgi:hypothetical protein
MSLSQSISTGKFKSPARPPPGGLFHGHALDGKLFSGALKENRKYTQNLNYVYIDFTHTGCHNGYIKGRKENFPENKRKKVIYAHSTSKNCAPKDSLRRNF